MQVLRPVDTHRDLLPESDAAFLDWKHVSTGLLQGLLREILEWEAQICDVSHNFEVFFLKMDTAIPDSGRGGGRGGEDGGGGGLVSLKEWLQSCRVLLHMLVPPFRYLRPWVGSMSMEVGHMRMQRQPRPLTSPLFCECIAL